MDKTFTDSFGDAVSGMFKNIRDTDLSEYYNMNRYTVNYDKSGILINYTIAGAEPSGLSIKIKNDILYVEAKKSEFFTGLKDAIGIPTNVSIDGITSKYKNGVLLIRMPYVAKVDERDQIEIVIE